MERGKTKNSAANKRNWTKRKSEFDSGLRKRAEQKRCSICKIVKPASEFYLSNINKDGLHGWCRACSDQKTVENGRKRLYGVTPEMYATMLAAQGGLCAICKTSKPQGRTTRKEFSVDHSHKTGKVRGLLCTNCNMMLGYAKDDSNILAAAISYLNGA